MILFTISFLRKKHDAIMSNRSLPSTFLKNPTQNGVGRYVCQLQRVTLKFCKSFAGSRGMRDFVENHLMDFVNANPGVVVYIKPRRHRAALISSEYLNGRRENINCNNMSKEEICKWLEFARTRSGDQILRFRKNWHTDVPSIQGIWNPFLNKEPFISNTQFPDPRLSEYKTEKPSATAILKRMASKNKNLLIFEEFEDIRKEEISGDKPQTEEK